MPTSENQAAPTSASEPGPGLVRVNASDFSSPHHPDIYTWNYSTGGDVVGLCVASSNRVTCTGSPDPEVPDLTEHFPGRPGAIEVGPAGLRYTFVEGVPPTTAQLESGHVVEIGATRCAMPDHTTLSCEARGGSFTISGPEQSITSNGSVLAEDNYSNSPEPEPGPTGTSDAPAANGVTEAQPQDFIGASGLVSGVRTASGQLVTASVPPCDGRGILILASFVETPGPQQGIADLLDRYPGSEFATPGQCPSLRARVDGARVYPIYIDYGHDTAALCGDASAREGNARLLSADAEFVDPC